MKFIELFGGIGGFRLGMEKHEHECIWYNDFDKYCVEIYNKNFNEKYEPKDIKEIDVNEIPNHDILCAGFPCPSWSIAGKRKGFDDERGELFWEILRIAKAKKPDLLFLENVRGILSHNEGKSIELICEKLNEIGYIINFDIYNSKDFGVPQNRERVFFFMYSHNRINKKWRIEEDTFIEDNFKHFPVPDIAKQLRRSEKATRTRIERLGYSLTPLKRNRQWTEEEIEILVENYKLSIEKLQQLLPKRTYSSIYSKLGKLGIKKKKNKGWHFNSYGRKMLSFGRGKVMAEHRYIVERDLGRKLSREEQVHHINCDKTDNRLENLYVFPNASKHLNVHHSLEKFVKPLMERNIIRFNRSEGKYELCKN